MGTAKTVDRLVIHWPRSGVKQTFENIRGDQLIVITEGVESIESIPLDPAPFRLD